GAGAVEAARVAVGIGGAAALLDADAVGLAWAVPGVHHDLHPLAVAVGARDVGAVGAVLAAERVDADDPLALGERAQGRAAGVALADVAAHPAQADVVDRELVEGERDLALGAEAGLPLAVVDAE